MSNQVLEYTDITGEFANQIKGEDLLLGLEAQLTEAAFGHEYALLSLSGSIPYLKREEILQELENCKKNYFWAREQLDKLNPDKLFKIEENLRCQKSNVFKDHIVIH